MRRTQSAAVFLLAIGLLTGGSAHGAAELQNYDGETLFKGLFLGAGPVAGKHPDLIVPTSGRWQAQRADHLIQRMRQHRPAFFASFAAAITSGDRIRIERAAVAADELAAGLITAAGPSDDYGSFVAVDRNLIKETHIVMNKNRVWTGAPVRGTLARDRWVNDVAQALAR
ncbi:hypothetical protein [Sphaerisporangium dianthi]|uniref:Uncharacterized protein n=1 Tax=Sphaerisporangium dianthi TaxID=1436120 RepID=A0ABV9CTM1_9ACTN